MDSTEIAVVTGGITLIVFVLWYFFGERKGAVARIGPDGVQRIAITVKGGYSPDVIVARRGRPLRLEFFRDEASACSERVILGDFGIARDLPAFQTTTIEFTPEKTGEFSFTCEMNMIRGKLKIEGDG
jgi:plastocyanin domain-containing protein